MLLPKSCLPSASALPRSRYCLNPRTRGHGGRTTTSTTAAPAAPSRMTGQVQKPKCDRRSYQDAVLANGLRVLAIQDTDAVFAAACANVQAGYFDDPALPGAAHFLEHMVHLGSGAFPDEREYKAFLAAHAGSSNASTSMVNTRYHFKVHASALGGALARLGAALSCPLLSAESAAREVENVHAEYSRNTNSDSRKLLQLKRSLCEPPYSGFSTGSIKTLWEEPAAAGVSVPDVLRTLWGACYGADSTTVAVVGPQETHELLQLVQEAFGSMRRSGGSSSSGGSSGGSNGGSNGVTAGSRQLLQAADGDAAAGMISGSGSGSSSSSSEERDVEVSTVDGAAGTFVAAAAAPEAAVHTKAQQELWDPLGADAEPSCSQIAAPEHSQQQQQQRDMLVSQVPMDHQQQQQQQQQQQWHRYPVDVCGTCSVGQFVRVCPQRDLREVQVVWYIPAGAMTHSSVKPWHLASHLLGHEVPGSVAHLLKAQGLVQSLSVGTGDEVRLGRGWMFWGATLSLTQEGEQQLRHVLATLLRGVQVLQRCSDAELQQHWQECASLAGIKFNWRDTVDPLGAAQAAAYALHYYEPQQVLSGPVLMTGPFDAAPIRWFLQQLTPASMNVFWSSRCHNGSTDSREPFYGAHYSAEPLPQAYLDAAAAYAAVDEPLTTQQQQQEQQQQQQEQQQQQQEQQQEMSIDVVRQAEGPAGQQQYSPLPGELFLPPANWAIPTDFALRHQDTSAGSAGVSAGVQGEAAPARVVQQAGLCVWHKLNTSFWLPKVHLKLHIVTPAVYATPAATVSARLLLRVLDDLLLPLAYPAELAGSSYSLSTGQGGLLLKVSGFPGVAQQLLVEVLQALADLTAAQVAQRFSTMRGRLTQGLTNWAANNPSQHSEYAAHHLLQQQHHHNRDLLAAAAAAQPEHLLQLQQQLASGADMHLDMLAYGNISNSEAVDIAGRVQQLLPAQGLASPDSWPPLGRVYSLSGLVSPEADKDREAAAGSDLPAAASCSTSTASASAAAAVGGGGPVTYLPDNPNPSNSNHAVYYWVQLGPDDVATAVLAELFAQMAAKPAFHELRTRQRLGYSVHLSASSLQRQLGLVLRVQSPSTRPDAITSAVRGWLEGFRGELAQLVLDKLDTYKQSLLDKYLEPAKSLHEAAARAWQPIGSSRTLVFDRRLQKAAAVQDITQQQLMDWYDLVVQPAGQMHHALCVHVWGGVGAAPADAAVQGPVVAAGEVAVFKERQQLLAAPPMQMPTA